MVCPAASASPVPAATVESAVFLIANGSSNLTVGLDAVSVLTATASRPVAAPAGAASTAAAPSATERTRKRAAARVRTRLLSVDRGGNRAGYRCPRTPGPRATQQALRSCSAALSTARDLLEVVGL